MLKKVAPTAVAGVVVLLMAGCSGEQSPSPEPEMVVEESPTEQAPAEGDAEEAEEEQAGESIDVDEGLLTVDITIPAEFYEGVSEEDIAQSVQEEGYTDFVMNPDGSVTFTMSKAVWEEALREMKMELDAGIQEIVDGIPDVVKSVTYDDDLRDFEVVVDRVAYESSMDAQWIGFSLNFQAQFYQLFAGVPEDERSGETRFIDEATGEVFDTQAWPVSQ